MGFREGRILAMRWLCGSAECDGYFDDAAGWRGVQYVLRLLSGDERWSQVSMITLDICTAYTYT